MCSMLCALLGADEARSAPTAEEKNACLRADAATAKQIDQLNKTKLERHAIAASASLKPWMDKVNAESKAARGEVTEALELCRKDKELGPRARRAAVSRLKKRLRHLDETDKQITMMQALGHPQPRIDPSVLRVLER